MLPKREESQKLLEKYIENPALRHHSMMVAQTMAAYATKLGQDPDLWYQTGLLHDLDWEKYPDEHPNKALKELLTEYPEELRQAVAAHAPDRTGTQPHTILDKYLFACDELSGFLHAYSLMRPEGFTGMKTSSVKKKLKDKSFAANVNRDDIAQGFSLIEQDPDQHIAFLINVFQSA
ncbi:MAG TPA: HDIG domain-containing protein [Candidatus Woesebacteria bacterium]|nr:HDIG domain-containing protein [Candidatus Woesebacteria bacterium]